MPYDKGGAKSKAYEGCVRRDIDVDRGAEQEKTASPEDRAARAEKTASPQDFVPI